MQERARLFHFSEERGIEVFQPRAGGVSAEPVVWAIDEWHAPHFYFPRDCPRVNFWRGLGASAAAEELLAGAERVAVVEAAWLDRIRGTRLHRYEFDPEGFELYDPTAGYHVARKTVRPISVLAIDGLQRWLAEAGVELRAVRGGLYAYQLRVVAATPNFSSCRLRDAADYRP